MARTPKTRTSTVPAVSAETHTVPAEPGIIAAAVATVVAFVAGTFRITDPDGTPYVVPVSPVIARIANAVRVVPTVPAGPDRWTGIVTAVRDAWNANGDPTDFSKIGLNRSPWAGNVTETQNAIYCALVMARVPVTSDDVTAIWRALLPVTKCDFGAHRDYGFSTFAGFVRHDHGNVPTVPDGNAWIALCGRYGATGGFRNAERWTVEPVEPAEPVTSA